MNMKNYSTNLLKIINFNIQQFIDKNTGKTNVKTFLHVRKKTDICIENNLKTNYYEREF